MKLLLENWRKYLSEGGGPSSNEQAIVADNYVIVGSDHGTHNFAATEVPETVPKIVWSESDNPGMVKDAKLVGNHYFPRGFKLENWDIYQPTREEALAQDFLLGNYDSFKTQLDLNENKTLLDAFMEAVGRGEKTWLRKEVGAVAEEELRKLAGAAGKYLDAAATDKNLAAFDTAKNETGQVQKADEMINVKRRASLLNLAKQHGGIFVIGASHIEKF